MDIADHYPPNSNRHRLTSIFHKFSLNVRSYWCAIILPDDALLNREGPLLAAAAYFNSLNHGRKKKSRDLKLFQFQTAFLLNCYRIQSRKHVFFLKDTGLCLNMKNN